MAEPYILNWHIALITSRFRRPVLVLSRVFRGRAKYRFESPPAYRYSERAGSRRRHHGDTFVFGTLFIVIGVFALFLSLERRAANRRLYVSFERVRALHRHFLRLYQLGEPIGVELCRCGTTSDTWRFFCSQWACLRSTSKIDLSYQRVFRWMWRFHALLAAAGARLGFDRGRAACRDALRGHCAASR